MQVRITKTITFKAEAATRTQLSRQYKVNRKTFSKWLKLIPCFEIVSKQRILTPKQVARIYEYSGSPE